MLDDVRVARAERHVGLANVLATAPTRLRMKVMAELVVVDTRGENKANHPS